MQSIAAAGLCVAKFVAVGAAGSAGFGDLKITSTSTERQKRSQNLAPVLVIISGHSLVFSRKIITSLGFYRCCAPARQHQ